MATKKDRPMLSVTSLLYGSTSPNLSLFNNNNNNNGIGSISPNNNNGTMTLISQNNNNNNNLSSSTTLNNNNNYLNNNVHSPIQQQLNCNNNNSTTTTGMNIINNNCDNNNNTIINRYPPNHPLSGSKHLCAICEDRASGKHYGVYSCEGCKGFFKRTVRKDLTYVCRDDKNCIVDKRQRNRCQYCRYQKCLEMGMKREAVQEERQRNKPTTSTSENNEPESSTTTTTMLTTTKSPTFMMNPYYHFTNNNINDLQSYINLNIERLTEAEKLIEINTKCSQPTKGATKEIELLFKWIKNIPYFQKLEHNDQLNLLKSGWNELLIAEFSYRSTCKNDALLLANGVEVSQQKAQCAGIGDIFSRVLNELVAKMRQMQMDRSELGCLRAIVLFNPALKDLKDTEEVEKLRDRVYSLLENHCRLYYSDKTSRFAKLLVRLPALRSIGLKCIEPLFFQQYLAENNMNNQNIEKFISYMLMKTK